MRYNPYKRFVGSFLPNWLLTRTEISSHAKLVFARLAQYAGADGASFPHHKTLCEEVGLADSTMRKALAELIKFSLVQSEQNGLGRPNSYFFLEHEWDTSQSSLLTGEQPSLLTGEQMVCSQESKLLIEKRIKEENQSPCSLKANAVLMPKELNSPAFDAAWAEWVIYRKQIKKPMPLSTISRQLKMLALLGCENAILSIEQSIAGGWHGLFAPKEALRFAVKGPAPITNEGIWQGYLDSLCREWNPEAFDRSDREKKYVQDQLRRARNHVGCDEIRQYLGRVISGIPAQWEAILEEIK